MSRVHAMTHAHAKIRVHESLLDRGRTAFERRCCGPASSMPTDPRIHLESRHAKKGEEHAPSAPSYSWVQLAPRIAPWGIPGNRPYEPPNRGRSLHSRRNHSFPFAKPKRHSACVPSSCSGTYPACALFLGTSCSRAGLYMKHPALPSPREARPAKEQESGSRVREREQKRHGIHPCRHSPSRSLRPYGRA